MSAEMRMGKNAEAHRQAAIVRYVRAVAPHVRIWHVPNGGLRNKREAAKLRWTGLMAGVPDLTLMLPEGQTCFWEVKTPRRGLSEEQKNFRAAADELGHRFTVVRSIEDARKELALMGVQTREVVQRELIMG